MKKKPLIIAVEGVDGVGKLTLSHNLIKLAEAKGLQVEHLSFPNYKEPYTKKFIKAYLSGEQMTEENHEAFQIFCGLNRKLTFNQVDEKTDLLVLDRYVASSVAYRCPLPLKGITKQEYRLFTHQLEHELLGLPEPDLYLLCWLPIEVIAMRLLKKKRDAHEINLVYLKQVQNEYFRLYQNRAKQNWFLLPQEEMPPKAIAKLAWAEVSKLF